MSSNQPTSNMMNVVSNALASSNPSLKYFQQEIQPHQMSIILFKKGGSINLIDQNGF